MYSDKDFQTFWFRYKTEGEPHGISINSFCINQGVPYKQFYAWFKKHAKDTVIPVEIEGAPTDEETDDVEAPPQPASKPKAKKSKGGILITIQTTDGLLLTLSLSTGLGRCLHDVNAGWNSQNHSLLDRLVWTIII